MFSATNPFVRIVFVTALVGSCLCLSACFSVGKKIEQTSLAQIQKGKTTKTELLALLGEPTSNSLKSDGQETLEWSFGDLRIKGESFLPVIGPWVGGTTKDMTSLQVSLGADKIVHDYVWSESRIDSNAPAPGWPSAPKVPFASQAAEAEAKLFRPDPKAGLLYVFRERRFKGGGVTMQVFLDGRLLGAVTSGSFAYTRLEPGRCIVRVWTAENTQDVAIDAAAGKLYFLKVEPQMGMAGPRAKLSEVAAEEGTKTVGEGRMIALSYDPQTAQAR